MRAVIQHVAGQRADTLAGLLRTFPDATVVECRGDPMETFIRAMQATAGGALFFEDDAILCDDFAERCEPYLIDHAVTFFRRDVKPDGFHWYPGSRFSCTVAFWAPPGMAEMVAAYAATWPRRHEHPTGWDLLIRDWLVSRRWRFGAVFPSLVQHAEGPSLLGPRSSQRQSPTWRP